MASETKLRCFSDLSGEIAVPEKLDREEFRGLVSAPYFGKAKGEGNLRIEGHEREPRRRDGVGKLSCSSEEE
jgi:hypothetical protein